MKLMGMEFKVCEGSGKPMYGAYKRQFGQVFSKCPVCGREVVCNTSSVPYYIGRHSVKVEACSDRK